MSHCRLGGSWGNECKAKDVDAGIFVQYVLAFEGDIEAEADIFLLVFPFCRFPMFISVISTFCFILRENILW